MKITRSTAVSLYERKEAKRRLKREAKKYRNFRTGVRVDGHVLMIHELFTFPLDANYQRRSHSVKPPDMECASCKKYPSPCAAAPVYSEAGGQTAGCKKWEMGIPHYVKGKEREMRQNIVAEAVVLLLESDANGATLRRIAVVSSKPEPRELRKHENQIHR